MILLEYHNKIIEDVLLEKLNGKHEALDAVIADFDAVTFHLSTDANAKNILQVSVSMKFFNQLKPYGVDDVLKQKYGQYVTSPESGYDVTLKIDCEQVNGDKAAFAREVALLKRHILAAPFYKVFGDIEAKRSGNLIEIHYRDNEAFYLKPEGDRCIVIFSIYFQDPDDAVLAKTFIQEYQDARRTISNAPAVNYSQKEPPLELKGVRNLRVDDKTSFVSFVLFAPHITGKKKETSIDNIQTFRNYLQYHIKCSKAYMHTRMRERVRGFLQVLNRAKSEPTEKTKKTITGKTFARSDDPPSLSSEFNI
jgi:actin related protein 2/3 complex subunit 2